MLESLKTITPGDHLLPIELNIFKDIDICVVVHLKQYIKMTVPFRNAGTNQLLLSLCNHISQSQQ